MKRNVSKLIGILALLTLLCCAVFAMTTTASAAAPSSVMINGITLTGGKYLAEGATSTVSSKPSGRYAYYNGTGTLTLYNFNLSTSGSSYLIYSTGDLILDLQGTNTLSINDDSSYYNVVYVKNGDLTISGSGKLTVTQKATNYSAIKAKNLTINGGTLVVNSVGICLTAQESVGIYKGSVTLNTTDKLYAISCSSFFDMTGGNLNITSAGYGISVGDYTNISGGNIKITSEKTAINANNGPVTIKSCELDIKATGAATGIYAPAQTVTIQGGAEIDIDVDGHGIECATLTVSDVEQLLISAGSSSKAFYVNSLYLDTGLACSGSQTNDGNNAYALTSSNVGSAKYAYIRSDIDL
jgi:hypothetical protein